MGRVPFSCVGQFRFVELNLLLHKSYTQILRRIGEGACYFDVGCCFAQDMRKAVQDGATSTNMFGLEMHGGFVNLAYDFFGDRDTLRTKFIIGDLNDRSHKDLVGLERTVDILHAGMFLHLWDLEGQTRTCERLVEFMSRAPGSVILGCSAGRVEGGRVVQPGWASPVFKHNVSSFEKMWHEVGRRTSTSWRVDAGFSPAEPWRAGHWDDPDARRPMFEVIRI